MKRLAGLILALALAAGATGAAAQGGPPPGARPGGAPMAPQGEIRGTVRDGATGQPLAEARIAVWSARDSVLVTGGVSRNDGTFRVEGLRPGQYYLRVSRLGYTTATVRNVALAPAGAGAVAAVGDVRLETSAVALEGLTATAERSTVVSAPDRTVVSARDLPSAAGGNASDVLRSVPGVEVDGDGKVSVRGNPNVAVQINGRPAPLTGDALTNFLKQVPANMIDRVEVVPNPSARYDPDGMGGILNIVLRQDAELGLSGGVNLSAGSGDRYNGSGNLGYQRGALTLFGTYGFNTEQRASEGFNWRENRIAQPLTFLRTDIEGESENAGHNVNLTADLRLSRRDVLSAGALVNAFAFDNRSENGYTELDADREVTSAYERLTTIEARGLQSDLSLGWRRTVQPTMNETSAEVRWNRFRDRNDTRFLEDVGGEREDVQEYDAVTGQLSFQLDVTRPFLAGTKLETGYKGILRGLDNDQSQTRFQDGAPVPGSARDNAFEYDEDVHAAYAVLTRPFGRLSLQGGLRVERADTRFTLSSTGEAFDNDYTSLFPSAAATFQLDDRRQVRASYSRRIQRPDARLLNPFSLSEDPLNRFVGNPELKPEYTDALELGLQQSMPWGSVGISPFYRRTTDAIGRLREVDDQGVATTTFRNLATRESYGSDLNTNLRLLDDRLMAFASFSVYRQVSDASNVEEDLGSDAVTWSVRGNLTYRVTPTLEISYFQFYRAPQDVERGRIGAFSFSNLAVRQKVWGERASLSLRVSDPWDMQRFTARTTDNDFLLESRREWDARAVYLAFSYNFGQAPRMRPRAQPEQQQPMEPTGSPIGPR